MKLNIVNQLACQELPWLDEVQPASGVAVSCRIRLARNLADYTFPRRADEAVRQEVFNKIAGVLSTQSLSPAAMVAEITDFDDVDRSVLLERHLASPELCKCGYGSGIAISSDETATILINEEDHLRLQILLPGMQLAEAWRRAAEIDAVLNSQLNLAFSSELGYLTACPTNVGTGLRASVMLHLPALLLAGEMEAVMNAVEKLSFTVRGILGEGTNAIGNFFQVSNQSTLGESEEEIIMRLERVIRQLVWHEQNARVRLIRKDRNRLYDHVGRAYGILRHAHLLNLHEALNCLSAMRLGVDLGMFSSSVTVKTLNRLMLAIQPGHLQKRLECKLTADARDMRRAEMARREMRRAECGEK